MGLYLVQVLDANGRTWLDPVLASVGAAHLSLDGSRSAARSTIGSNTRSPCCSSAWWVACSLTPSCGCSICCRSIRKDSARVSEHLAFNTAVSFTTNTNWQSYGGETTMSYFSQMVALTFHNFVSAATGIAIAAALVRAIARHRPRPSAISGSIWCASLITCSSRSAWSSRSSSCRRG